MSLPARVNLAIQNQTEVQLIQNRLFNKNLKKINLPIQSVVICKFTS